MIPDINKEAENSLNKSGYDVVYQYPQSFSHMPVISFYTVNEHGSGAYDNAAVFRDGTVVTDIWALSPSECVKISVKVRECMLSDGWSELFSADVPQGGKVYHRTMRFIKSFYIDKEEDL